MHAFIKNIKISYYLSRKIRAYLLNRVLKKQEIQFVWSLYPLSFPLNIPYATPVWDLQHRLQPFWPEVSAGNQWELRESAFRNSIQKATFVITGTEVGAAEVSKFYGVAEENILVAPFPFRKNVTHQTQRDSSLIFYPAQFWPHKNHVNLILGFNQALKSGDSNLRLVLPGSDKGNLFLVKALVRELGIEGNVIFPGFISDLEIRDLYMSASLMIFPSYFGPDNLPPLEALAHGCPVAVAEVPGAREQFGQSVIYFDPDSPGEISEVINKNTGLDALEGGTALDPKYPGIEKSPQAIAEKIGLKIVDFCAKRRNWE